MHIAENIKRLRRARDITQDDLAELLSVTPQAV
ncbi:MAG: helix-turn-helix domain-containing protein, partial [Oscillospiraceae bacterium]|nr:helix-turn-helix domain-containing protein [Oscillospiraceae bacterium]